MAESKTAELSNQLLHKEEQVSQYRLVKNVGSGAAGEVWLAHNEQHQSVALKMLHPGVNPELIEHEARFLELAQNAQTKYVLKFYEFTEFKGKPVLVTEFIDNNLASSVGPSDRATVALRKTLVFDYARSTTFADDEQTKNQSLIQERKPVYLDLTTIGFTMFQVTDGLVELYQQDLLHRDVKPSNIGIRSLKEGVLLDFGGACKIEDSHQPGPGTVLYMSPERALGLDRLKLTLASEAYALGITIYELITQGEHPFFTKKWLGEQIEKAKKTAATDTAIANKLAINILGEMSVNCDTYPFRPIILNPQVELDSQDKFRLGKSAVIAINQDIIKLLAYDWRNRLDPKNPEESLKSTMFRLSHNLRQLKSFGLNKNDLRVAT